MLPYAQKSAAERYVRMCVCFCRRRDLLQDTVCTFARPVSRASLLFVRVSVLRRTRIAGRREEA